MRQAPPPAAAYPDGVTAAPQDAPVSPVAAPRGPGDVLVPVGAVLFGIGVLAIVVVFVLFLVTGGEVPLALSLASGLAPLGLASALVGLVRQGRAASREARRQRAERRTRPGDR